MQSAGIDCISEVAETKANPCLTRRRRDVERKVRRVAKIVIPAFEKSC